MLGTKGYVILFCITIIAVAIWGSLRSYNKILHPPQPRTPWTTEIPFKFGRAINGTTIETPIGIGGKRTRLIHVAEICSPAGGDLAEAARKNLELSAGKNGHVEVERPRLFENDADDELVIAQEAESIRLGTNDLTGICTGETGIDLGLDQLEHGFADYTGDDPKSKYAVARDAAKQAKRGIWASCGKIVRDELVMKTKDSVINGGNSVMKTKD